MFKLIQSFSRNNYECEDCGECIDYNQYEENPSMCCPNCGGFDIEQEH